MMNFMRVFAILCCLLLSTKAVSADSTTIATTTSKHQYFTLTASTKNHKAIPINQFHQWIISIKDASNQPVYPAKITIGGGMPSHGHGLPTQPQITRYLGQGKYLLEGLQFNMDGMWLITFHIATPTRQDTAQMDVKVSF